MRIESGPLAYPIEEDASAFCGAFFGYAER
jgi:hypothetical protein